jgi:hypothetical protein
MSDSPSPTDLFRRLPSLLPTHWRRRRGTLGPYQVMMSLMTMTVLGTKGYERTLQEMKDRLGHVLHWNSAASVPTGQALSQARRKLTPERCREIVAQVQALCTTARSAASLGYGGLRLLAIDGSKLALPAYRALRTHFGCPVQAPKGPQASLTLLWDVGANHPVDWQVGPYRVCERLHAQEMISCLGAGDLLLADCNFSSRRILFALNARKADWLMGVRCSGGGTLTEVSDFIASGRSDDTREVVWRNHRGQPIPEAPALMVRLLRLDLPTGKTIVFITSLLDRTQHPAHALVELYTARWRVETAFRELKIWHGLERFHARYPAGIIQEIAALMLFQLLASELEAQARIQHKNTLTPVEPDQPNQLQQLELRFNRRLVGDCAVDLLYAGAHSDKRLETAFQDSLFRLWRQRQYVRRDRSFPRERKSPVRGWKDRNRKRTP